MNEYEKGRQDGIAETNAYWEARLKQFVAWLEDRMAGSTNNDYVTAIRGVIIRFRKTGIVS